MLEHRGQDIFSVRQFLRCSAPILMDSSRHSTNQDSLLRYADQEVFGLVMLFNQSRTQWAEAQMQAMTQHIIEAALALGGRYYLPYRLHATVEQFYRAYPQAHTFFALKRKYDPHDVFQNEL